MTENFNSFEVAASTQAQASAGGALAPYLVPHGDGITYVMTPKANRYLRAKQMANDTESNQAQINTLDVIIAINSSYPEPYIKRGILLTRQGEIQLAVADFTTAISLDINCAIAFSNRGTCRNMIDRFDLALDDFNSALTIKDDLEAAYFGRPLPIMDSASMKNHSTI